MATRSETLDLIIRVKNSGLSGLKTTRAGFADLRQKVFSLKSALVGLGTGVVVRSLFSAGVEAQRLDRTFAAITGSSKAAAEELAFVRREADRLGQEFYTVAGSYKGLLASSQDLEISQTQIRELFVATLESATALGMAIPETEGALRAFVQMLSKGNVQAEELRGQLGERMYGAFNLAAKSMGVTTQELNRMLERGEVLASDLLPRLARAMHEKYGQAAVDASFDAQQGVNRFTTAWKDLRVQLARGGFLDAATDGLKALTDTLKDPAVLSAMKQIGASLASITNSLAKVATTSLPGLLQGLNGLITTWNAMPKELQTALLGAYLGKTFGPYGALTGFAAGAVAGGTLFRTAQDEIDDLARKIEELQGKIERARTAQDSWRGKIMGGDVYQREIERYEADIKAVEKRIEMLRGTSQRMALDVMPAHTPGGASGLFGTPPTLAGESPTDQESLDQDALAKSRIERLKAITETGLSQLEALYEKGAVSVENYFERRQGMIEAQYKEEIDLLKEMAAAETDPEERLEIEDELFKLQEEKKRELIDLTREQERAEADLLKAKKAIADADQRAAEEAWRQRRDIEDALGDLEARAQRRAGSGLLSSFATELAEMDARHAEEIQRLRDLNASKEEIDEAYRLQKMEKDRQMVEQEKRLNDERLTSARTAAGGLASIFQNLYELTGESNKELFALAKAAAIAEAVMNTAQAVTKAYAEGGPYAGPALAAIVAAAGAVQIATISAQSLATGGMVLGRSPSPTADNIPIAATAGEFMQPVSAVRYYGPQLMEALRTRAIPREWFAGVRLPATRPAAGYALASGGSVPAAAPAGGQGGDTHYFIQAVDARSFMDLCKRNPSAIAGAMQQSARSNSIARRTIRGVR